MSRVSTLVARFWDWLTVARLTVIMCFVAAAAIVLYVTTSFLDAWLPNIGVAAVSVAVTAAVVEELIRRAERERVSARISYSESRLDYALLNLLNAVQIDYIRWRWDTEIEIGGNPLEVLARWLDGSSDAANRTPPPRGTRPHILVEALSFTDDVQHVAEEVREHVSAELAVQMSQLAASRRRAEAIAADLPQYDTPSGVDVFRARLILQAAKEFAEVYGAARPEWPWFLILQRGVLPPAELRSEEA